MTESTDSRLENKGIYIEARKIFDAIDEEKLRAIISSAFQLQQVDGYMQQLHTPVDSVRFAETDESFLVGTFSYGSGFQTNITLYPAEITKMVVDAAARFVDEDTATSLFLLKMYEYELIQTLLHEQIHAFGFYNSHGKSHPKVGSFQQTTRGFHVVLTHKNSQFEKVERGYSFNEAYVDYRAGTLTKHYLLEEGVRYVTADDVEQLTAIANESGYIFKRRCWVFEQLLAILATILQKSEDEILKLFDQEYLNTGEVLSSGLKSEIDAILPGVTDELYENLIGNLDTENSPVFNSFSAIVESLPNEMSHTLKDRFAEIYKKFNRSEAQQESWK